jgi:YHS domain-containing protein
MEKDPVCGMTIDAKMAAGRSEYQGVIYYFCAPGCMQAFDEEPGKFVNQDERQTKDNLRRQDSHD